MTPSATSSTVSDGVWAGNGQVTISYAALAARPLTITHIAAAANQHRQVVAGVTFTDPHGRLSQLSGNINWGDGTTTAIPHKISIKVPQLYGGGFAAGGTHTYSTAGTYTVTITIHDSDGASAAKSTTLTVPGHQGLLGGILGFLLGLLSIL